MRRTSAAAEPAAGAGTAADARPDAGSVTTSRRWREFWALLLLGAAGSGLVLVALRQEWARVTMAAPRPLPATAVVLTGQDLVPAVAALAVAALASLAAVMATRRVLRRITGLIAAGLGVWIAVLAASPLTAAEVLAAAQRTAAPAAGSGAGAAAGSVTAGGVPGGAGGVPGGAGAAGRSVAGFPAHLLLAASGWRGLVIGGALAIAAAGIVITLRADRLPVMSGRYERPLRPAGPGQAAAAARAARSGRAGGAASPAGMWDVLSAGGDPTAGPGRGGGSSQ